MNGEIKASKAWVKHLHKQADKRRKANQMARKTRREQRQRG